MPEREAQFAELERRLRQAGIIDRCSRRLVEELEDHYCDLCADAQRAGHDPRSACEVACRELGTPSDIAAVAAQYRELLSITRRYPLIAGLASGIAGAGLPVAYCAERRESIARWSASVGLATIAMAGLLLSLQTLLGVI